MRLQSNVGKATMPERPLQQSRPPELQGINTVKVLLAISILALHSSILGQYTDWLAPITRCGVPFFFVAGSYFFWKTADKAHLQRYVKRLALLYVVWFAISLPVCILSKRYTFNIGRGLCNELFRWVKNIFLGSTWMASWYITATVIGTVIIFYASKKLSNKVLFAISLALFCLGCLEGAYNGLLPKNCFIHAIEKHISLAFSFLAGLVWIVIGKMFAQGELDPARKNKGKPLLLALSFLCLAAENTITLLCGIQKRHDQLFLLVPTVILLFSIASDWNGWFAGVDGKKLRIFCTVTYCAQGIVIPAMSLLPEVLGLNKIIPISPVVFLLSLLCTFIMTRLIVFLHGKPGFGFLRYFY